MKKGVVTLAVIFGLGITQSKAQSVNFGVKADASMSNFIMQDFTNVKSNMNIGAAVGGFANIALGKHFALQPELLFQLKDSKFEQAGLDKKIHYEYWGVEIPVYAVGNISLGNGKAYLGIGPYLGFGIDAKYRLVGTKKHYEVYDKEHLTGTRPMQRWDVGAGAMLGYEFGCGIQLNAGYKIGFIDAMDAGKDKGTLLNQLVSLGLGYRF